MSKKELNFDNAFSDLEEISEQDIEEAANKQKENNTSSKKEKDINDPWAKKTKTTYRTTINIDPKIDETYLNCKRKFRNELKTRLTKQDAVELGLILLDNLDPKIIKYIKENFAPDDDIIEELKKVLDNL
ncbi:MAG: hypothetical protein ACOC1K_00960 [Nanoarchaeota archaeon]